MATRRVIDADRLWSIREDELHLSRQAFAAECEITEAYLWKIEHGQARPSPEVRGRIVEALERLDWAPKGRALDLITARDVAA